MKKILISILTLLFASTLFAGVGFNNVYINNTHTSGTDRAFLFNGGGAADTAIDCDKPAVTTNAWDAGASAVVAFKPLSDGQNNGGRIFNRRTSFYTINESGGQTKFRFVQAFDGTSGQWDTGLYDLGHWYRVQVDYNASSTTNDPTIWIKDLTAGDSVYTELTVGSGLTETTTPVGTRRDDSGLSLILGNNGVPGVNCYDGALFDYRLFSSVLSASDRALAETFQNTATAPIQWFKCDETSGTTIADSATGSNDGTASGTLTNFFILREFY